jgi:hypothetical protein
MNSLSSNANRWGGSCTSLSEVEASRVEVEEEEAEGERAAEPFTPSIGAVLALWLLVTEVGGDP